jgi:hypothetical protein
MTCLERLFLDANDIDDDGLANLRGLDGLKLLSLNRTHVTGAGLEFLNDLPTVNYLNLCLDGTRVDDESLQYVAMIRGLYCIHLNGTQISDVGLECLSKIPSLKFIEVANTKVTDAGLVHLHGMGLQFVDVRNTKVSDEGAGLLKGTMGGFSSIERPAKTAIIRYMIASTKDAPKDASEKVPQHAIDGIGFLQQLREKDPELVAETEKFLYVR